MDGERGERRRRVPRRLALAEGDRYPNVQAGFAVSYPPTDDRRATDYGYNLLASGLRHFKTPKVLMMDYRDAIVDFDGYPQPTNDDDDATVHIPRDRHRQRINVLLSDGSVASFTPVDLHPSNDIYVIGDGRGTNPALTASGSGSGGGNGNGNGNGKATGTETGMATGTATGTETEGTGTAKPSSFAAARTRGERTTRGGVAYVATPPLRCPGPSPSCSACCG